MVTYAKGLPAFYNPHNSLTINNINTSLSLPDCTLPDKFRPLSNNIGHFPALYSLSHNKDRLRFFPKTILGTNRR